MMDGAARTGRLFDRESGRSFVAAVDHGMVTGVRPGTERLVEAVELLVSCRPEGILVSPGALRLTNHLFSFHGAPAPIVRGDLLFVGERVRGLGEHHRVVCEPEAAAALGADGVVMFLATGVEDGAVLADNATAVARAAERARRAGLFLVVETVLWGGRVDDDKDPELLTWGCRMAVELGADVIKTEYTGDPESMARVVGSCPVPLLVLGGPRADSEEALAETTRGAVEAGARGVVYGRNIWQAEDPARVAGTVKEIVHGPTGAKARTVGF